MRGCRQGNALAVNPYSVEDIAAGLYRLLGDAACRERLRRRGPARAAVFTWQACAHETYRLYGEAADAAALPVARHSTPLGNGEAWLPH